MGRLFHDSLLLDRQERTRPWNSGTDPAATISGIVELASMKGEALKELDLDAFAAAVRDVLKDEPDGLRSAGLYAALDEHWTAPPMKYLHVWLAELSRADEIVHDLPNKRYLHPKHASHLEE